jgi:hypothetical protein
MKIAVMQPYLFPYIGYFQLINAVNKFVIYDDVNFIKQGWINRNRIVLDGKEFRFTLELKGASSNKLIKNIEIGNNKVKLIKTLKQAYFKSPYYNDVIPMIEDCLDNKERLLSSYLVYALKKVLNYLSIETEILISSDLDYNKSLKGQDKILNICKSLNASEYYNSIGGNKLYSKEIFKLYNLDIYFIKSEEINYKQFSLDFKPNLSIIDVLMFNSISNIKLFLKQFTIQ